MVLYVTEQGAQVGLARARLVVRKAKRQIDSVRIDQLDQLVLCGPIQVTTQAQRALLRAGVETAYLTQGGAFIGRLVGATGRDAELRRQQYRHLDEPEKALALARRVVTAKLRNQRALMLRFQRRRPDDRVARALVTIRLMSERIPAAANLDVLRGLEGNAAAAYFKDFGALFTAPDIEFTVRARRPPPDPVNILLSFGYTLLGHLVQGYVELAGLDPYFGALHATGHGRPSLALDLMEEMRPVVVDSAVLRAFNTKAVRARDFIPVENDDAPVEDAWARAEEPDAPGKGAPRRLVLTRAGAKRWFACYERRLADQVYYAPQGRRLTYRQAMREQVYRLARHLRCEEEYQGFCPRG